MAEAAIRRSLGREERRRQILETALAVFTEKGFHAANVADVAARAGISQGTIYLYFDSKEALLEAAVRSFFEDFGQQVDDLVQKAPTASEKLRSLGQSMAELARAAAGIFSLFLGYWVSSKDRDRAGQLWADLLLQGRDPVIEIIEEGMRNGEFRTRRCPFSRLGHDGCVRWAGGLCPAPARHRPGADQPELHGHPVERAAAWHSRHAARRR